MLWLHLISRHYNINMYVFTMQWTVWKCNENYWIKCQRIACTLLHLPRQISFKMLDHILEYIEWVILYHFNFFYDVMIKYPFLKDSFPSEDLPKGSNECLSKIKDQQLDQNRDQHNNWHYVIEIMCTCRAFCCLSFILSMYYIYHIYCR